MNMQFGQELVEKAGLKWKRPYPWLAKVEPNALTYTFSPPTTLHQPELGSPRRHWTYAVGAATGTFSQPGPQTVVMRPEEGRVKLSLAVKARETR